MKYNRLYAAFIFAFWAGCSGDGQYKEALLPQIDVNEEYPEKEIFLQDVADIEYIPLETNEEMLFQGTIAAVSDKGILGVSQQGGKLFLFDRDGKAKNLICRKGDGPEEYNVIQRVDVDKRYKLVQYHKNIYTCLMQKDKTGMLQAIDAHYDIIEDMLQV